MIDLMKHMGLDGLAEEYRSDHEAMKNTVNDTAWDGEWYKRYFEDDGSPIGSKENSEGKIYTNAQSWTILAGYADRKRAARALQSVNEKLNTACGIKLSWPGYNGYDKSKGGVTSYPPGAKENGGIFLHSNPWVMIAETMIGNGDRAFEYYSQINPAAQNERIEVFECEPYCYPQNILGDEHPQFGLARNSWLSGTSSWMYQTATQYILGIRPQYDSLLIDPCIPKTWSTFSVTRRFRDATYHITVKNPDAVSKGVRKMIVDGKEVSGQTAPVAAPGSIVDVQVVMGEYVPALASAEVVAG